MHKHYPIKKIKNILLSLVVTLLVIHTVTPHSHHRMHKTWAIQEIARGDVPIFSLLSRMVGHDLGSGHLEHVLKKDHKPQAVIAKGQPSGYSPFFLPAMLWITELSCENKTQGSIDLHHIALRNSQGEFQLPLRSPPC